MKPFRTFNAEIRPSSSLVFGGGVQRGLSREDVKYPIMLDLNEQMFVNLWGLGEIHLNSDLKTYRQVLTPDERRVYNIISGYLTLLDSIADKFNFLMSYLVTDGIIRETIRLIGSFEGLHTRTYQFLTSTMLNDGEKREAFNAPREIPLLLERNELVVGPIQEFVEMMQKRVLHPEMGLNEQEKATTFNALVHNLILEGVFFTGGFTFFHSLAREDKMIGSNNAINLIKEDETQHNKFYGEVIKIFMHENPEMNTTQNMELATSWIRTAVEKEKEWASYLFDGIYSMSIREYHDYVEYLANVICRNAGIVEIYPDNQELKSRWILEHGRKSGAIRADFFEVDAIDYIHEEGGNFDF